jgi:hypothetical protein
MCERCESARDRYMAVREQSAREYQEAHRTGEVFDWPAAINRAVAAHREWRWARKTCEDKRRSEEQPS